jgi:hypothetical protein
VADLGLVRRIYPRSMTTSRSHFPADLATLLAIPASGIFFIVGLALPRPIRTVLLAVVGIAFVALGVRLFRERRLLRYLYGSIYIFIGLATFYIAYVAALFV